MKEKFRLYVERRHYYSVSIVYMDVDGCLVDGVQVIRDKAGGVSITTVIFSNGSPANISLYHQALSLALEIAGIIADHDLETVWPEPE